MRKLLDYLPYAFQRLREIRVINETEQPEIEILWENVDNFIKDQFVEDSTERGVSRWEKILKINPKGTATLDDRKFTILTRINENLPFTMRKLEQQLTLLCGADGFSIDLRANEYAITVKVALTAKNAYSDVGAMLKRMIPANMIINQELLYNTWGQIKEVTWGQLAPKTWREIKEEVL